MTTKVDLSAIKARLGSIPEHCDYHRDSVRKLIRDDLPALIKEVEDLREEVAAATWRYQNGQNRST
jgi:hypothetical protein